MPADPVPDPAPPYTSMVVNLSGVPLSDAELSLLSKGLSFCPTPPKPDAFKMEMDLEDFYRRLRLKDFYHSDSEDAERPPLDPFKPKKKRGTPHVNREPALETYIQAVNEGAQEATPGRRRDNLTRDERMALTLLKHRVAKSQVVIKPADKRSATVVWSFDDYVAEAIRQLGNTAHYRPLEKDPTSKYTREINLLTKMSDRKSITEDVWKYLSSTQTKPARFYLLPNIHKLGNPGRPIISSCDAPTERISKFVDHHLRPLVRTVPSYIKDTTDFLMKLQSLTNLPSDTLLVTLDVSSLYTNIPHAEGIAACIEALNTRETQSPPTANLAELISEILNKNAFVLGEQHLQVHGTAMCTQMSPSYANLFMAQLERRLLDNANMKPLI